MVCIYPIELDGCRFSICDEFWRGSQDQNQICLIFFGDDLARMTPSQTEGVRRWFLERGREYIAIQRTCERMDDGYSHLRVEDLQLLLTSDLATEEQRSDAAKLEVELRERDREQELRNREKEQRRRRVSPGAVYVLRAEDGSNRYKIGRSKRPYTRSAAIGTELPFPVTLLHTFPCEDTISAEREIHERFAGKRLNGEWFELTGEDVDWLLARR